MLIVGIVVDDFVGLAVDPIELVLRQVPLDRLCSPANWRSRRDPCPAPDNCRSPSWHGQNAPSPAGRTPSPEFPPGPLPSTSTWHFDSSDRARCTRRFPSPCDVKPAPDRRGDGSEPGIAGALGRLGSSAGSSVGRVPSNQDRASSREPVDRRRRVARRATGRPCGTRGRSGGSWRRSTERGSAPRKTHPGTTR